MGRRLQKTIEKIVFDGVKSLTGADFSGEWRKWGGRAYSWEAKLGGGLTRSKKSDSKASWRLT